MAATAETVRPTHVTEAVFHEVLGTELLAEADDLEQQAQQGLWQNEQETTLPSVIAVAEKLVDTEARSRAERLIRRAGSLAVHETVTISTMSPEASKSRSASLLEAAQRARIGDKTARKVVETNVLTDLIERSIKAGHVMSVDLEVNSANKVVQHGQLMDDVHINALRFASEKPQMRGRAEAETRNGVRIELAQQHGLLNDYCFVVFSRYPDNMTEADADKVGFFTETKSCAIQVTTFKNGHLVTESAFVAGVKQPGGIAHDAQVINALAATFGHDLSGKGATDIIDSPLLIHKSLMQNGVIDLVRKYDDLAGGTFFGEQKPRQNYETYVKMCREREASLGEIVQRIANRLIVDSEYMSQPPEATRRLHKLSQQQMVDFAISNGYINPRVFGATAAGHIEDARFWLERGQYDRYEEARNMAQNTARSSSCPTSEQLGIDDPQDGESGNNRSEAEQPSEKKMMNCPFCGAKVWGDPCARVLKCWDCNACAKDGKVVNSGDGGHKARAERAAAEAAAKAAERKAVAAQVEAVFAEMDTHDETDEEPVAAIGTTKPDLVGVS